MGDSELFGVSIRGWLTVVVVSTVCAMQACGLKVEEPLYSLVLMASGFYLGQKNPVPVAESNPAQEPEKI